MTGANVHDNITIYPSRHGSFAHYASDEGIGQFLRLYGEWAEDEIVLLRPFVPRGGTVLDLGANIGTHTLAFAQMVGPQGLVVAIEGQASVHKLLTYNVVCNGAARIVWPLNAIAGETVGMIPCTIDMDENSKNYGLANFRDPASIRTANGELEIQLPIVTIDSLGLKKCDLIKIDVEGMELPVLKGARQTLSSVAPIIYFEQSQGFTGQFAEIYELLRSLDYKLYWHVANPFNRNNFKGATQNIFGGAVEVNVLGCPARVAVQPQLTPIDGPAYNPPIPPLDESIAGVSLPDFSTDPPHLALPVPAAAEAESLQTAGVLKIIAARLGLVSRD
jgi:FkbM family methyltransferase